jgi:hypothetical protein
MLTVLSPIVNIIGGDLNDDLMIKRIFTLIMHKILMVAKFWGNWLQARFGFGNHLLLPDHVIQILGEVS